MSISPYELFLVLVIGHCISLIFAIQFIPKKHTEANRVMQYLLIIYSVFLFERVIISELETDFYYTYRYLTNVLYLLLGPFTYTYIRRLLFYKNGNYTLKYVHYLPAALYFIYCLFHIYNYNFIKDISSYAFKFLFFNDLVFFVSISAYLIKSYALLNFYDKNEKQELSFNQPIIKFIKVMLICLSVYMVFWVLGILERFVIDLWIDIALIYDISCLILGIQIYVVGFYSLKHPGIFKIQFPTNPEDKPEKRIRLDENEISKIQSLVNTFFEENKGYRRPELSLSILANEIDTTTNKLSWVLNNSYKKSFYELVNGYRVKDFIDRITENEHKEFTLISIAFDVGFNSRSTFYKVFKEMTEFTPTEYIKNIENGFKDKNITMN
ncbi:helix-turn-helix domain-containing protein [Flagellimonas sp. S174]|uniref:helix-turn-helix domain-containing protein n=1 Tax=Flagellimonas sp. S174 TaxID=3410790 RepID=UPI003BF56BEC